MSAIMLKFCLIIHQNGKYHFYTAKSPGSFFIRFILYDSLLYSMFAFYLIIISLISSSISCIYYPEHSFALFVL